MAKIYDINKIPAELMPLVGGKARGLCEMAQAGFMVPKAFIVTNIEDADDLEDVVKKYHSLKLQKVSVRSSATLEDGNDFSAAGQFSTYLDVEGDEALKKAIRDCVASLHNATAEHYQKTFLQNDGRECRMTCVVQQMVDAKCAGVIFTQAPMKPSYTLIEVVPGLGENLVSGKMAAQQYRVRKKNVERMPENPLLSKLQVIRLGEEAKKMEKHFGRPMDLEYAINQRGRIQWLQARPITMEESTTINELDSPLESKNHVITTANIGEVMPGAVTPLNLSTNMLALDWGVMETYLEIGAITKPAAPYTYIAPYYNHMFFDMTNMYTICHRTFGTSKETLDISLAGHVLEGEDVKMLEAGLFTKIHNTRKFMHIVFAGDEAKNGMDNTISQLHFDLEQDMHGIYAQILEKFDLMKWVQYYHYRTSYYSGGQSNFLLMAFRNKKEYRKDPNKLQALIAGCLTEIEDFESANVLKMMRELAGVILAEKPEAAEYSNEELTDYFRSGMSETVQRKYNEFMLKHGHRGIREMEISCLSWRDNTESFASSMRSVLATYGKESSDKGEKKHWQEYADELFKGAHGLRHLKYVRYVRNARKGVRYREYTKAMVVYALDQFKQAYAQLARLMTAAGLLPDENAIYFLLQDEVGQLLQGDQSLVKKALARRRLYEHQTQLRFPEVSIGAPQPLETRVADPKAKKYKGTPVSRGIATGTARVVHSEDDAAKLQKGEIMVVLGTDIGWTPYYDIIGGLVTEIGSALSHGVVVAREYALPTVVNIESALTIIHTGDNITVDGNTGTVFVNKRAEEQS